MLVTGLPLGGELLLVLIAMGVVPYPAYPVFTDRHSNDGMQWRPCTLLPRQRCAVQTRPNCANRPRVAIRRSRRDLRFSCVR